MRAKVNFCNERLRAQAELKFPHYSVTTELMSKIDDFSGGMFCHTQLNAST